MLRWRLLLGVLLVSLLVGLCWLDLWLERQTTIAGLVLFPLSIPLVLLAANETCRLSEKASLRPVVWVASFGSLLVVVGCWGLPLLSRYGQASSISGGDGAMLGLAIAMILAFLAEMWRYMRPGHVVMNLAAALFVVLYIGVLFGFLIQLRVQYGLGALAGMLICVKMGDTGAYCIGRLFGRHPMARVLSPKKTMEGALGAVLFSCLGALATSWWLIPAIQGREAGNLSNLWGWMVFGVLMAGIGILGDLGESLLKRDAAEKDSSTWMPGFGGVLDVLDSPLLAAPVAFGCWLLGLVGG